MQSPSQRIFEADLQSVGFRGGCLKKKWDVVSRDWPIVVLWIRAAARKNSPNRFYIALNLEGYRTDAPTGTFWDRTTCTKLDKAKRPKGKVNSRFAMVFRTDWEDGQAFYHPYDRVAANGHSDWPCRYPHLVWTSETTIVDYLEEFHSLLNSDDYVGV